MDDAALSNELLALAGETDNIRHSRKRPASASKGSSTKRRKHEMVATDSDGDFESEEDEHNEYPLEGKFKDEADREHLLSLPEIKREAILTKRMEEIQKGIERRNIEKMVKSQAMGGVNGDADSVARPAKRKHVSVGSTKEKSRGLEALKQKRQAKESRRANKAHDSESPVPRRQQSATPSTSSLDEEGQLPNKIDDSSSLDGVQLKVEEKLSIEDFNKARLTRDMIENQCMSPHFEEYVKGAWVRLLVGMDQGQSVYRLCEIIDVSPDLVEPYQVGSRTVNRQLELRHAGQTRAFPMWKISCGPFSQREVDRVILACEADKIKLPTRAKLQKKGEVIHNIDSRIRTDAEITAMIARQKEILGRPSASELFSQKASLNTHRTLAIKRGERDEVERLTKLISAIEEEMKQREAKPSQTQKPAEKATHSAVSAEALVRVNERNRKANLAAMRKAELELAAKRKREANGLSTDLSARVKTVVRTRFDSRAGTPGTPVPGPSPVPGQGTPKAAPETPAGTRSKVDELALSVVIEDLF